MDSVKVTEMGFVTELMYSSFRNDIPRIRKLDADHYIVLGPDGNQVGDVREFNHYENRASSVNSLRQTFRKLRNVINANVLVGGLMPWYNGVTQICSSSPRPSAQIELHSMEGGNSQGGLRTNQCIPASKQNKNCCTLREC